MTPDKRSAAGFLAAGILAAGLLPVVVYLVYLGGGANLSAPAPFRSTGLLEQWLLLLTAVVVKPIYVLLSLGLVVWLWRQKAPDLVALRWGLIAFWLGENACTLNFLTRHGNSELLDYLHNFGMAVSFSFITYAALEGVDRRLIKYSAATDRCAALSLCRACIKYADVPCGLRRVFTMLIPATLVVALIPLCAAPEVVSYDTSVVGSPQHFHQSLAGQWFEIRYCPWLAILLLASSWLVLRFKREDPVAPAKVLFAAGLGPLGFGMMRLFLFALDRQDLAWSMVWEEITELLFVIAVAFVLVVFRQSVFVRKAESVVSSP